MVFLLLGVFLVPVATPVTAQGDFELADLDGLQRAVARYWMAPMTVSESRVVSEINEQGTPTGEYGAEWVPVGTPDPTSLSGTALLAVIVAEFDTQGNADAAFDRFDESYQELFRRDPRTPEMTELSLEGIGDRAHGYAGRVTQDEVVLDSAYATVQDGHFVYSLVAQFVGLDVEEQVASIMRALVTADAGVGDGEFRQDGSSGGGLWEKLALVEPVLVEGSIVTDIGLHPPSETPPVRPEDAPEPPRVDLDNPASIEGIESLHHRSYGPGGDHATPDSAVSGIFRIDVWIMTFDSPRRASDAEVGISNTLMEGIGVYASEGQATADEGGTTTRTSINEGFIQDPSLPPGNAVVHVTQAGSTVYGVVAYAVELDPKPVASGVIEWMVGTPASAVSETTSSDGASTGGVWARFPEAGDPILDGLVPMSDASYPGSNISGGTPVATPAA